MVTQLGTVERFQIYIGLKDKEKLMQLCTTEDFMEMVSGICADYRIAFSMNEQIGGYMMANGTYITENSLVMSISGFSQEQVLQLAEELRVKLNQETIMVSRERPELYLIKERTVSL